MLRHVPVCLAILAGLSSAASALQQPNVLKVSAEEVGKDFEQNTDAAVRKYLPPRPGSAGGVLLTLTGVVAQVDAQNREVGLSAGQFSRIILAAKNIQGIKAGDKIQVENARFRTYAKRTILIDCDEVKLAK